MTDNGLDKVQHLARSLRYDVEDLGKSAIELQETVQELTPENVTPIKPKPTAMLELTEPELEALVERFPYFNMDDPEMRRVAGKVEQVLHIERGSGGGFSSGWKTGTVDPDKLKGL